MLCYKITNLVNGHAYIGATSQSIEKRLKRHREDADKRLGIALYTAVREYGWESFRVEEIACARTWDELLEVERLLVEQHGTYYMKGCGYNMTIGGKGSVGFHHSEEAISNITEQSRLKMENRQLKLKIQKGLKEWRDSVVGKERMAVNGYKFLQSDKAKAQNPAIVRGRKLTTEQREKLSRALKGRKHSHEHREKISGTLKGRIFSEESKKKMSISQKRRIEIYGLPEGLSEQFSKANKGKPKSVETRERMAESARNASAEIKARRTAAIKAAYARKKILKQNSPKT